MLKLSEEWQLLCKEDKMEKMTELVVFLGLGDQRTIENCNLMKLGKAQSVAGDTLLILGQVKDEARINEPNAKKLYWCI
jgi:hypothetical protein